jgi:signal transduction histidine kinase
MNSEAPALYRVLNADDLSESHWKSYLGVPILAQGTVQGVMDLFGASLATFSPDQVTFFATLGQQVGTAIQNARLYEEVQVARERLQTLSAQLVKVQEAERRTIARELHDEVGQILTGLNLTLELVARLPPEQVQERIEHAQNLVNELMLRVRKMSLELRPPMLDDLGLLPALLWHFEHYTEHTGVQVIFKHTGMEQRFPAELETAVYRMIQEALTNVARYAGVGEVVVRLWANQEALSVQVEDQGSGFDPEAVLQNHTSSGLSGMHERIRLLNGRLTIESAPGQGSYLAMELPLT